MRFIEAVLLTLLTFCSSDLLRLLSQPKAARGEHQNGKGKRPKLLRESSIHLYRVYILLAFGIRRTLGCRKMPSMHTSTTEWPLSLVPHAEHNKAVSYSVPVLRSYRNMTTWPG